MIQEDYCSFEVSKLLKEKGFDEACRVYYEIADYDGDGKEVYLKDMVGNSYRRNSFRNIDEISAPTHQMAMKWLREKGFEIIIEFKLVEVNGEICKCYSVEVYDNQLTLCGYFLEPTPEEAAEAALKYTLKNLI